MHTVITHVYQSFGFLGSPYSLSYPPMQLTCLNDNFGQRAASTSIPKTGDEVRPFYKRNCFKISNSS